ncbi:MAG: hypothetical protein WDN06_20380 [Asticcacaulis sp.]
MGPGPAPRDAASSSDDGTAYVDITCKASDDKPARLIEYKRSYNIHDGKLVAVAPADGYLNQAPLKATYAKGVRYEKRPNDPKGFNLYAPNFRIDSADDPANTTASFSALLRVDNTYSDINARLTLADKTTEDAYVRFFNDSSNDNLTQMDTTWQTKSPLLLTKPLTVELIGDGKSLASSPSTCRKWYGSRSSRPRNSGSPPLRSSHSTPPPATPRSKAAPVRRSAAARAASSPPPRWRRWA